MKVRLLATDCLEFSVRSQAVETLLEHLELDKRSYRLGLSQVRQNLKIGLCLEEGILKSNLRKMLIQ